MSLRLRILLLIAAVNVAVLLVVVWLGLEAAGTRAQVGPEALREALGTAYADDLPDPRRSPALRFAVRLAPGQRGEWERAVPLSAEDDADEVIAELERRLRTRQGGVEFDRRGLSIVNLSPQAEWRAVYVGFTEEAHVEALEGLRTIYILLSAGTVLLILGTYVVLRQIVLAPLERLVEASQAVAEGRAVTPILKPKGNDEVGNLVSNFNSMAAEVHEYQQHLEERVLGALQRAKAAEKRLVVAQRLAATGTLAAGFAHEINNPVGGTINALRKLKEGDLSPAKQEEYFELALDGLNRIRTIVERILHFTPRRREPADLDVAEACHRAADLARHRAERRGVEIEVSAKGPLRGVIGDSQELIQALLNLILNAIDAYPEGEGGRVTVGAQADDSQVLLRVTDDGAGMEPEVAERCVDLFYSTKPEGQGTGLGLAIVQHIVTDHGGALDIQTARGEGTTVRIRLPREHR